MDFKASKNNEQPSADKSNSGFIPWSQQFQWSEQILVLYGL